MRQLPALILLLAVFGASAAPGADEVSGEYGVHIPPGMSFSSIESPGGIVWSLDIDLRARLHYSGMMGEPRQEFITMMTIRSLSASRDLTYTDPDTGRSASAGRTFRPGDAIIDELGAREAFDSIKFIKAYYRVDFAPTIVLSHVFMDQEVHSPSGRWGFGSPSILSWSAFHSIFDSPALIRGGKEQQFLSPGMAGNDGSISFRYSEEALKSVKAKYALALKYGFASVTLLNEPKPEFTGIYEFENAVMRGLRERVEGMPKPEVAARSLDRAMGKEPAPAPSSPREASRTKAVDDVLAKRLAAIRDAARSSVDSALRSGRVSGLGDLPKLRGRWQAINRYIDREKAILSASTRALNGEADRVVNLREPGLVGKLENAIAIATARDTAAALGTVNFTCPNHTATVSDAGGGKIRFSGKAAGTTVVDLREMSDATSTSGGGQGTLRIFAGGRQVWWLGDCRNIDDAAARKLELVSSTLRRGIGEQRALRRQIEEAARGVVAVGDDELAREIAAIKTQADNAAQKADIGIMRRELLPESRRAPAPPAAGKTWKAGAAPKVRDLRRATTPARDAPPARDGGTATEGDKPAVDADRMSKIFGKK